MIGNQSGTLTHDILLILKETHHPTIGQLSVFAQFLWHRWCGPAYTLSLLDAKSKLVTTGENMSILDEISVDDQKFLPTNVAQLQRWLPWLRMFRGFRVAIDYQKMLVSLLAVFVWMWASHALTVTFFDVSKNDISLKVLASTQDRLGSESWQSQFLPRSKMTRFDSRDPVSRFLFESNSMTWPFERVMKASLGLVKTSGARWWYSLCQLFLGLAIASLFGGAISRMVARELAGKGRSMIRDSEYALKQFPAAFFAPLIALFGLTMFGILNWGAGFLGRIPVLGELVIGLIWGVLLLIGGVMAFILVGLILGWPLMVSSSAVEKNDAFDGLSRSFCYLLNRPWYAVFLVVIAVAYGSVLLMFVDWMTRLSVAMSLSTVGTGLGREVTFFELPTILHMRGLSDQVLGNDFAAMLMRFWMGIAALVPIAFAFSFFWTSTTIGYLLLRRREDGTPLNELDLSDSPEGQKPNLPVVGIPAAEKREAEISAAKDE